MSWSKRLRQGASHRGPCPSTTELKDHPVGDVKGFIKNWHWYILIQDEWFGKMVKVRMGEIRLDIDIISRV